YFAICAVTLVFAYLLKGHSWSDSPYNPGVYATFTSNIVLSFWGGGGEWLRPTWTLAVEEQFYLFLPLLIVITPKRWLLPVLIVLWTGAGIFRAAISVAHPLAAFSLLPGRMDLLLAGVMAAYAERTFDLSRYLTWLRAIPLAAMALLVFAVTLSHDW